MGITTSLKFNTAHVVKSIEDSAAKKMAEATQLIRTEVLETLSGNRTGKIYRVPETKGKRRGKRKRWIGKQRLYTASAPGEPPAQATGALRQSITASVKGEKKTIVGRVGSKLPYAARLEFGFMQTDKRGRRYNMAPRPWLRISFEKKVPEVKKILRGLWFK